MTDIFWSTPSFRRIMASEQTASLDVIQSAGGLHTLTPIERLCILLGSHWAYDSLKPNTSFEALMLSYTYPARSHQLRQECSHLVTDLDALQFAALVGADRNSQMVNIMQDMPLDGYLFGSWLKKFHSSNSNETKTFFNSLPPHVRDDGLFQQILSLKSPIVFEAMLQHFKTTPKNKPVITWDQTALGLAHHKLLDATYVLWPLMTPDTVRELIQYEPAMASSRKIDVSRLAFTKDHLETVRLENPSLFLRGLVHSRPVLASYNEKTLKQWVKPMLNAVFIKIIQNPGYLDTLTGISNTPAMRERFNELIQNYAPEYGQLLALAESLHGPDIKEVYQAWASAGAGGAYTTLSLPTHLECPDVA